MEAALTNPSGRMTLGSSVVRIGSVQDNHVVINDPMVAPHHAEIRPGGERTHTITDLGSTTGTFVNERRLDYNVPALLRPNDTIRIGDAIFNYEVTGAAELDPAGDSTDRVPHYSPRQAGTRPPTSSTPPSPTPPGASPASTGGNPDQVGAAAASPQRYPSTAYFPPPAFAPPPTGDMAPVSPPGVVPGGQAIYTVASLLEKENRWKLWLAGGLTAFVILLVALLFGSFHSPGKTLDTFCSALQSGDYQTAYNQLSPGLQGTVPESKFANSFSGNNRITSCMHSSPTMSGNSAMATLITHTGSGTSTVITWLIQDSSFNWKIDNLRLA